MPEPSSRYVLQPPACAYKANTEAISIRVRQEFTAKAKARNTPQRSKGRLRKQRNNRFIEGWQFNMRDAQLVEQMLVGFN